MDISSWISRWGSWTPGKTALRFEGRPGPQVAIGRWFRNTLRGAALEFGCEILSENPEAAAAAPENAEAGAKRMPVVVLPVQPGKTDADDAVPQVIVAAGQFGVDQGLSLTRGRETGYAVLIKMIEQGPGFRDLRLHAGELSRLPDAPTGRPIIPIRVRLPAASSAHVRQDP